MKIASIEFSYHEKTQIREALRAWRLLDRFGDADLYADAERCFFTLEGGNRCFNGVQVLRHIRVLDHLSQALEKDISSRAAPEWVAKTKKATEAGFTPLVPDPEKAVALLCEVRERQLTDVQAGLALFQRAGSMLGGSHE